jgi:magnesium-transporting ATPase (P-type)
MMIIDRYKRRNRVVAMTGDGVNDALASIKLMLELQWV